MNYLTEIKLFYDWLETNSISDSGIVLWHALMHVNNKAGWITEFAVAISTLETKTGLKKGAILRARQRLQQAGRIDFKSRAGQQSAIYKIIPFVDNLIENSPNDDLSSIMERKAVLKPNANQYTKRTQSETQTSPISNNTKSIITTKLNETKNSDVLEVQSVDNVCPICEGRGWYVEQQPFNNGLSTKDVVVHCSCKNTTPAWAANLTEVQM
jgi:hypothetical protein